MDFPKNFDTQASEAKWYATWLENKVFSTSDTSEKPAYSILMPPPNVTGILHFGHILNMTLQDLYTRKKRMEGFEACWFPGQDHAGIATQARVEKELKAVEGLSRHDLGRENFIEKVWVWKEKYGDIIFDQKKKLGISADWDRLVFTLDDAPSKAVCDVFIKLFDEGLIYRGKRIINWSPLAQTALSDEEVEFREVSEHIYTLKYHFEDGSGYLKVATVRPETIYGDTAVAVNPADERYKDMIGKMVRIPYAGRLIPVIADDYADPAFGTGCVKITPAHDPNDFEVGQRHDLEMINTINPDATLNSLAGEFAGMERFEARKAILQKLQAGGFVEKIEDYTHNVGFSQRGGEPVEPYLSDQWFVKMKPLAQEALECVLSGEIKFYPSHWVKTYEHWMNNIRDWCISRQLWWGHRIPVFYTEDGRHTAAANETEARAKLGLTADVKLRQDEDVLDTWFSSWLWPLTTMSWDAEKGMEGNPTLNKFLPTDLLVTGPDIIFFWVARMIMATKHFGGQVPFRNVYFTSMIRDGQGRKLSKSLGNSPDPLNIIARYGADAVRFTMLYLSPLGQDVRMDVDVDAQDIPSMELGRNFANKVWNAGRFLLMKKEQALAETGEGVDAVLSESDYSFADKWVLSAYNNTIKKCAAALDEFRVTDYSKTLYEFIWKDFCDWYIEILKIQSNNAAGDPVRQLALANFALGIYEGILRMLHPVMPFITEEIWHLVTGNDESVSISKQEFVVTDETKINEATEDRFEFIRSITDEIRKMRAGNNIPPSKAVRASWKQPEGAAFELLNDENVTGLIKQLAKLGEFDETLFNDFPFFTSGVYRGLELRLENEGIDVEKEKEKLSKEIERLKGQIEGISKKLSNETFVSKAPEAVIAGERKKLNDMTENLAILTANLEQLG